MDIRKRIEEASLNAWPPLQTLVYDGWLIRFADGYTKRANSVNPIYPSENHDETKIADCEEWYRQKGLPTVFKITPFVHPADLDAVLERRGYALTGRTSVQRLSLDGFVTPPVEGVKIEETFDGTWLKDYSRLNGVEDGDRPVLERILANIIPEHRFFSLAEREETVACGLGVLEDGLFGLFDIVVAAEFRGMGYGGRLIRGMLAAARTMGAEWAYLQVMLDNPPALRLYEKLGFSEAYQYWYRINAN